VAKRVIRPVGWAMTEMVLAGCTGLLEGARVNARLRERTADLAQQEVGSTDYGERRGMTGRGLRRWPLYRERFLL
jgi:hypothetical protein